MTTPLYEAIYNDIKTAILNNDYEIGTKLPTDKVMAEKYSVSTITIKNAMDLLKKDQLISRKPRQGSIVISDKINHGISTKEIKLPLIGLIFTDFSESFGADIIRSIINHSQGKAQIIFKLSNGDNKKEEDIIIELLDLGVDGIILLPSSSEYISAKLLELTSENFPMVLIDRSMKEIPTCNVQIDNEAAAQELIENLIDNGHHHIGIITAKTPVTTISERIEGAINAHVSRHIPFSKSQIFSSLESMIPNSGISWENDIGQIKEFLKNNANITAIFAGEHMIATLVKQAIEELNYKIHDNYSVVCFDHPAISRTSKDTLTHIRQDQEAIGKSSMDLILDKIKNPLMVKKIDAPYELVVGTSVKQID